MGNSGGTTRKHTASNRDNKMSQSKLCYELSTWLRDEIKVRRLTQQEAANALQIDQPKVSRLINGKGNFTVERLFRFINRLGYDVEITVSPAPYYGPLRGSVYLDGMKIDED